MKGGGMESGRVTELEMLPELLRSGGVFLL